LVQIRKKHLASRGLLVVCAAGGVAYLAGTLPRDQQLRVRIPDGGDGLERATLALRPTDGREIIAGTTLYFGGSAPHLLSHSVSVPNGDYVIEIELLGSSTPEAARLRRFSERVELQGGLTTIYLDPQGLNTKAEP
jgi:hypothetical protein